MRLRLLGIVLSVFCTQAFAETEDDWGDESDDWPSDSTSASEDSDDWGESDDDDAWDESEGDDWGESSGSGFDDVVPPLSLLEEGLPGPDAYRFEATLSLETDSQFWLERIKSEPLAKLAETLKVGVLASRKLVADSRRYLNFIRRRLSGG